MTIPTPQAQTGRAGVNTLVRGSVLSALSVCVSMAALLVTGKLVTNALDQNAVGVFALLLVASDFIIYASGLGLSVSMPKLVAEADAPRRRRIIGSALAGQLALLLALGALTLLVWAALRHPEQHLQNEAWIGFLRCLYLLPCLFIVGGLRDVILAMLAGLDRYGLRATGITVASAAQVFLVYLFVWHREGGVVALTLAMAASYAIALAFLWTGLGHGGKPAPDAPLYRESVAFSIPLWANQLMSFFHQRFDTVLVASLAGVAPAAVYEMIKRIPTVVNRVLSALLVPYLPHIARLISGEDYGEAGRVLARVYHLVAAAGYGAVLLIVALQDFITVLLFNREYLEGTSVLFLLLTAACILLYTGIIGQMLVALGRGAVVLYINVGAAVFSLAANLLLIPALGLPGAGIAALGAAVFCFGLHVRYVNRGGVRLSGGACLHPHLLFLLAAVPLFWGPQALAWRLCAPALFAALCFATGLTTPRQVLQLFLALTPSRRSEIPEP